MTDELELLWADLLSEDPDLILAALRGLNPDERRAILSHLRAMSGEPGWSDGQARRARAALAVAAADPGLRSDRS